MGYIYNERTGEFKTISQVVWSMLMRPFKLLAVPFRLCLPLLRFLAWPSIFLKQLLLPLFGLLATLLGVVYRIFRKVVGWAFFPVIKWWAIAKEAMDDRDWFLLVIWCLPGLLLYLIYRPILLFLLGVLCDIVGWGLESSSSLIEWLKGVIQ